MLDQYLTESSSTPRQARLHPDSPLDGFGNYQSATAKAVVPLRLHASEPQAFQGRLEAHTVSGFDLITIEADPHTAQRTADLVAQDSDRFYKFSFVHSGHLSISQDNRTANLGSGDMAFYDTSTPYTVLFGDWTVMTVLLLPSELFNVPTRVMQSLTATTMHSTGGVAAVTGTMVSQMARQVDSLTTLSGRHLFNTTTSLLAALVEESAPATADQDSHEYLLNSILEYLDENVSQPDLSPTQIAEAHFISVRHLHAIFRNYGTSVSTVIRSKRLNRCYDDLVNPLMNGHSVTSIGLRHGFTEAAHFSRTFSQHFGMPPSAVRQTAIKEAGSALAGNALAL